MTLDRPKIAEKRINRDLHPGSRIDQRSQQIRISDEEFKPFGMSENGCHSLADNPFDQFHRVWRK